MSILITVRLAVAVLPAASEIVYVTMACVPAAAMIFTRLFTTIFAEMLPSRRSIAIAPMS